MINWAPCFSGMSFTPTRYIFVASSIAAENQTILFSTLHSATFRCVLSNLLSWFWLRKFAGMLRPQVGRPSIASDKP